MFCPKCGKPEQTAETYCRQCGTFLPDLSKPGKTPVGPEEHVKVNMVFSLMTMVACFTLAALLYSILAFRDDTHWLIYATAGLLTAMGFWHTQTFWRAILLRRHFNRHQRPDETIMDSVAETGNLLEGADFENIVPASVTDRTTKHLSRQKIGSPQSEH